MLKRRNKLWSSGKFSYDNLDDEADYSYLCGGNNNCREFNNLMSNLLGWSGYFNRNVNRITRYSRDILVRC